MKEKPTHIWVDRSSGDDKPLDISRVAEFENISMIKKLDDNGDATFYLRVVYHPKVDDNGRLNDHNEDFMTTVEYNLGHDVNVEEVKQLAIRLIKYTSPDNNLLLDHGELTAI